jgi:hypothetical protein
MIYTSNVILSTDEIPSTWIFEYYAQLPYKLVGQSAKIKSIFNPKDTNPSLVFYVKDGQYKFRDFSADISGNKVSFVKKLLEKQLNREIPIKDIECKIIADYVEYLENHDHEDIKLVEEEKWKIVDYKTRSWYMYDAKYWTEYGIGSDVLEFFNVKPLKSIIMNRGIEYLEISRVMSYAYTQKDGSIYKLYVPLDNKEKRFKNFNSKYIQGMDQLSYSKPNLVICSSLKDAMALYSFGLDLDVIAPNSETTLISPSIMDTLKSSYQRICILFDNDDTGRAATAKYQKKYNTESLYLPIEKDISDAVKAHGRDTIKQEFIKIFNT